MKRLSAKGSAEDKAAAEQAYRDANDAWRKLRDGEEPDPPAQKPSGPKDAAADEPEADEPSDQPATDEPEADEPDAAGGEEE